MKDNKTLIEKFNLPKYIKGKSFAEASEAIKSKFKDRDDQVSKDTMYALLERLRNAQEYIKSQKEPKSETPNNQMFLGGNVDQASGITTQGVVGAAGGMLNAVNTAFGNNGIDTSGMSGTQQAAPMGGTIANSAIQGASAGAALGPLGAAGGAVIGGVAGLIGGSKARKDASIANKNAAFIANSKYNQTDFADGGQVGLNTIWDDIDNINPKVTGVNAFSNISPGPVGLNAFSSISPGQVSLGNLSGEPITNSNSNTSNPKVTDVNASSDKTYSGQVGLNAIWDVIDDINPNTNNPGIPQSFFKSLGNTATDAMRFAPAVMSALDLMNLEAPSYERLDRLDARYKPNYIDEASLENQVEQQSRTTARALENASNGDTGALRSSLLANNLNANKALSQAMIQAQQINNSEDARGQQFNLNVDSTNLNQSNLENDINARNQGVYETNRSALRNALGQNIGAIGTENHRSKAIKDMFDYDKFGNYLGGNNNTNGYEDLFNFVTSQYLNKRKQNGSS